jgi:hypothetical protein
MRPATREELAAMAEALTQCELAEFLRDVSELSAPELDADGGRTDSELEEEIEKRAEEERPSALDAARYFYRLGREDAGSAYEVAVSDLNDRADRLRNDLESWGLPLPRPGKAT